MEDYLKAPGLCSLGRLPKEMPRRPSPPLWLLTSDLILPTPGPQNVYYTSSQQIHVGILSPTVDDDDNRCLVDVNSRPRLIECSYARAKRMKLHWQFSQVAARPKEQQEEQGRGQAWEAWEEWRGRAEEPVSGFKEHLLWAGVELVSSLTPDTGSEGVYYYCHCCCFSGILFNF